MPKTHSGFLPIQINGDVPRSRPLRLAYYAINLINNAAPHIGRRRVERRSFLPAANGFPYPDGDRWNRASPSRLVSRLYWDSFPWRSLASATGPFRILDLGCGGADLFSRIDQHSGGAVDSYLGIDLAPRPNWSELAKSDKRCSFASIPVESIGPRELAGRNLIVSQSALEHFEHDLALFETVARWAEAEARPIAQVHLVPARSGLRMFGLHGFRQYTAASVERLARPFAGFSDCRLTALGGQHTVGAHCRCVGDFLRPGKKPDLRYADTKAYTGLLADALKKDAARATSREAAFYALTILSHLPDDFHPEPGHRAGA